MSRKAFVLLGTGGTISGLLDQGSAVAGRYRAGEVPVSELLRQALASSGLASTCDVSTQQVAQIDSKDIDADTWVRLVLQVRTHLARDDVDALVITHGTDTLEETAYLLHRLAGATSRPVVLTGAMRPSDAPDADGPRNLSDALRVAADPTTTGVVVVFAGSVHAAADVRKVSATRLDAFESVEDEPLASVDAGTGAVTWHRPCPPPVAPEAALLARLPHLPWPRVELVTSHGGADGRMVDLLVEDGVEGLVVSGTGNGSVHVRLEQALARARARGVLCRRCTRLWGARISEGERQADPEVRALSPAQARLDLVLDLLAARA